MKSTELRLNTICNIGKLDVPSLADVVYKECKIGYKELCLFFNNPLLYDIKGIPLTEEWLVKFGFGKVEYIEVNTVYSGNNFYFLHKRKNNDGWDLQDDYNDKPIQYVHQLQNLYFALTGEELQKE